MCICVCVHAMSMCHHPNYAVGIDFTTRTGNDTITAIQNKGFHSAFLEILIHHDVLDEDEETFTAELQSVFFRTSATIIIRDTFTVFCSFDRLEYHVYESVENVTLTLISSRASPRLSYTVQVNTIYGIGNASGE